MFLKFLFAIFFLFFVVSPVFAGLDYDYPDVPGTTLNITSDSSLGDAVKYFSSWAIIIGAIVVFLSLIYAGWLYLSSSGAPDKAKEANTRIWKSFLGLAILIASYLIMVTLNPQLMVLKLEKTPVDQGVILLTNTGFMDLVNNGKSVEQVIKEGNAVYLPRRMADASNYKLWNTEISFGDWESTGKTGPPSCKVDKVNFAHFIFKYIGFLNSSKNVKIIAYSEKNFIGDKIQEYNYDGKLNNEGKSETTTFYTAGGFRMFEVDTSDFKSKVKYRDTINISGCPLVDENLIIDSSEELSHPPLSFEIKDMSPGVYLYADKGEERYLNLDTDFTKADTSFNDKAQRIEIKNDLVNGHDYIAVLHEKDNFSGQMKIFFEEGKRRTGRGDVLAGNTTTTSPRKVIKESITTYGYIKEKEMSSINVRELTTDSSVCKRVWLCTGEDGTGACLVYENVSVSAASPPYEEGRYINYATRTALDNPFYSYKPVNIPVGADAIKLINTNGVITRVTKNFPFEDNIKSIYFEGMEGQCMIALFENKTGSNFPGSHSEVFFESNKDLTPYQINKCNCWAGLMSPLCKPCASAIAIYPIKK